MTTFMPTMIKFTILTVGLCYINQLFFEYFYNNCWIQLGLIRILTECQAFRNLYLLVKWYLKNVFYTVVLSADSLRSTLIVLGNELMYSISSFLWAITYFVQNKAKMWKFLPKTNFKQLCINFN